jgi:assimilatory nitrate reductase catalytic subunit
MSVRTTCPYCGVGCGVLADRDASGSISVRGDPQHPANLGKLCGKGSALAETIDLKGRLLEPVVNGRPAAWDEALDLVASRFTEISREHGPDAVAFYVSGQLLTEDYYVVNKLAKGFVGTANIDTNSRLCMASSVAGHKRAFGSDTVPGCYEDLEQAGLLVLVGSNAAWCHPVLHQRMLAAKARNPGCRIVVVDPRRTATCEGADLHLPLRSGSDAVLFNGLLAHLARGGYADTGFVNDFTTGAEAALQAVGAQTIAETAAACGLSEGAIELFFSWFAKTERVVTLYSQGVNQSSSGVDKVNAIINCHLLTGRIGRPGMGPFSLTGQPNAMGGREVGGLANQLAAHLEIDNAEHRDLVKRFWQAPVVAPKAGLKAVEMFDAIAAGRIKAVWIMSTNPVVSLPDADRVRAALDRCAFVVASDCMRDTDTNRHADVLLPALAWGEKDGTVTNSERRISRQRAFLPAPGAARADWRIICDVAQRMGFTGFDYGSAAEIFREHAALSGFENEGTRDFDISALSTLDGRAYEALAPIQWPVTRDFPTGTARMFENRQFFTGDRRARFVAVTPRPARNATSRDYPLVLNTGRIRDQWHTMTRTGKSARLLAHIFEPCAEFHPEDARLAGLENEALVRLTSPWGKMVARVLISVEQRRGCVFVPMHWNEQFAGAGRVNALVNPATDPLSGQPESKHTPVKAEPYAPKWHVFILSRHEIRRPPCEYWVQGKVGECFRLELAFDQRPASWREWAAEQLGVAEAEVGWIAYRDPAAGRFRYAAVADGQLQGCVFVAPDHRLGSRSWLIGLFAEQHLSPGTRNALLAGQPLAAADDIGAVICSCFGIGRNQISSAIQNGAASVEAVGQRLKAGTNCGACKPEIGKLLAAARPSTRPETRTSERTRR